MAIYIAVVRICQCEICVQQWTLNAEDVPPDTCPHCGSKDWEWGVEPRDSRFVRQAITRERRRINPGAKSKKRQDQGRKQWRRFRSKEEEAVRKTDAEAGGAK